MTYLCGFALLDIALGHWKPVNPESHGQRGKQHLAEEVEQKWQAGGLDWLKAMHQSRMKPVTR